MKYEVIVTPEAERDIQDAFEYIAERSPMNAARWLKGLYRMIDNLEMMPRRFGRAREADYFPEELRQVIFKSHRILFVVDEGFVRVVHVRHAARRALGEEGKWRHGRDHG